MIDPSSSRCLIFNLAFFGLMVTACWVHAQESLLIKRELDKHVLEWGSDEGSTSFLQYSHNLSDWQYTLFYDVGDGSERRQEITEDIVLAVGGSHFYRLLVHPTNLDNPDDTDGDGLNNLFELKHGYVPVLTDSDDDGVSDGDEDLDEDGDSNLTEIANGTDANDSTSNSGGGAGAPVSYALKARSVSYEESYLLYGLGPELRALGGNPHYFQLSSQSLVNYHRQTLDSGGVLLGQESNDYGRTSTIYAEPSSYAIGSIDIVSYWNDNTEQEVPAEHVYGDYIYDMLDIYPFPNESQIDDKDDWSYVDGVALPLASYSVGWYTGWRSRSHWQLRLFASSPVEEEVVIKKHYLKVSRKEVDLNGDPVIEVESVILSFTFREGMSVSEPTAPEILKEDISVYPWELAAGATFYDEQISLVPVQFITDFNRDGMIDDDDVGQVTEVRPFRWWVNDDDDQGVIRIKGSYNDIPGEGAADHADLEVDGLRDVIDFFPLYLDIKDLLAALPRDTHTYKLSHDEGAFNFGELPNAVLDGDPALDGVGAYIRELTAAQKVTGLSLKKASVEGAIISDVMLDAFQQSKGVLILEVSNITEKPLWLEIFKGDELLGKVPFLVRTSGVEKMFRWKNLAGDVGAAVTQASRMEEPANYPDELTNDKAFFMIHGYEPELDAAGNQNDARGFNAEIFKRLHQSGSRAKFVGVTWNGATGKDYHQAVINAFKTSGSMKGVAAEIGGGDVVVAAHSLGNVVTSNAIAYEGFAPTHYFMVNAAVPTEAYSPTQRNGTGKQADEMAKWMTHDKWKSYYDRGLQKLFAAEWHQLFQADDNRGKLTWRGRFSDVVPVAYNFYSSGEDVLENPNDKETVWKNLSAVITRWLNGSGTGRHAWVSQEMAKGSDLASLIFLKRNHAGWKINFSNLDVKYTGYPDSGRYESFLAEQAKLELEKPGGGRLSDENLAQVGFFWRFRLYDQAGEGEEKKSWANLYGPIVDGNLASGNGLIQQNEVSQAQASAEAGKPEVQAELLASAIPAMSYAAGANELDTLNPIMQPSRNYDMELMFKSNGWPLPEELSREGEEEGNQNGWFHSDFWVLAPVYVQSLYLKWVDLAELDKE